MRRHPAADSRKLAASTPIDAIGETAVASTPPTGGPRVAAVQVVVSRRLLTTARRRGGARAFT